MKHLAIISRAITRVLMALIRAYQLLLSPWIGQGCRFEPTCSRYALMALERHGAAAGSYLALARIARCHPGCAGGHDPVPDQPWQLPRLFTGLLRRRSGV
ncbi:MAG: membrane protein insertion efficiency factor YidD [Burkholderiaceae bacterium]|jgi:putative membrane protein insertion efficiency factor|nr:membrane protein insertion efficiency factor YidD [Burkholderiaceae bacterium]